MTLRKGLGELESRFLHGLYDPMVPAALGQRSVEHLRGLGYAVDWRTYPMQHSVHPQELEDVGQWLRKVLG